MIKKYLLSKIILIIVYAVFLLDYAFGFSLFVELFNKKILILVLLFTILLGPKKIEKNITMIILSVLSPYVALREYYNFDSEILGGSNLYMFVISVLLILSNLSNLVGVVSVRKKKSS